MAYGASTVKFQDTAVFSSSLKSNIRLTFLGTPERLGYGETVSDERYTIHPTSYGLADAQFLAKEVVIILLYGLPRLGVSSWRVYAVCGRSSTYFIHGPSLKELYTLLHTRL